MSPAKEPPDPHAPDQEAHITCYVCNTDLTGKAAARQHKDGVKDTVKDADKKFGKLGLVEINSEGTGFAGGGKNMAKRQGVAFQC